MMNIDRYVRVSSLSEASDILRKDKAACILGGCGYLRLGRKKISTAIDLSLLSLSYITETPTTIEIGAMTPLRDIETSSLLERTYGSALRKSTEGIVGVQLRNVVTLGGTVAGRYPFSDILPVLMALETNIHFAESGKISLEKYMTEKAIRDVVEKISIPKNGQKAGFASMRHSETDYAILNAAVGIKNGDYKIFVGARPQKAVRAPEAEDVLNSGRSFEDTGRAAAAELTFGDNTRGSADYRKAICKAIVQRAGEEAINAV
ncbi:FAD binding domain-containing protein [Deferribacteres bacterium DY0037]